MRIKLYVLVLISTVFLSCSIFSRLPPGESGNIESVSNDDIEMNTAIQKAQETLPSFIQAFQSPTRTQTDFLIKARFPYGNGNDAEHIWIGDLSYKNNQFEGFLVNEPIYLQNIKLGDKVTVQISDISDWMIIDDNKLFGGYTIHVLRNRMTKSEQEQFNQDFGVVIPDEPAVP